MSGMKCPTCFADTPDDSRFCLACGAAITVQPAVPASRPNLEPARQAQPARQDYIRPAPAASVAGRQSPQIIVNNVQRPISLTSNQAGLSFLNIWGPFAGYGSRRRHVGWLMDGQSARHEDLTEKIKLCFQDRQIPKTHISWKTLTARGLAVESRPYFLIRRGLVSLALNVSPFGQDLFISMATYLKPPISVFRVLVLLVTITLQGIGSLLLLWAGNNAFSMGNTGLFGAPQPALNEFAIGLLCLVGPLHSLVGLVLTILVMYSLYKFFKEKDILAALRVPPNEFNEDDLMALEKAVEQTVRSGLDDIGLNPADLQPASVQGNSLRLI
jgi:hypothetical protein